MSSATTLRDVVIVGSGPAGVASALRLRGLNVVMLDVGNEPVPDHSLDRNFYEIKRSPDGHFDDIVGRDYEYLESVLGKYIVPKLRPPHQRYVTRDARKFFDIQSATFDAALSYARGGLANAWGAQLYRYDPEELSAFPFDPASLKPYYDELTRMIGISGTNDDLARFYGDTNNLLPIHQLTPIGRRLLQGYAARRRLFNCRGIYMGAPRLAIATARYADRPATRYECLEFFRPRPPHVYQPAQTLDRLIQERSVEYTPGVFVERFEELADRVVVHTRQIDGGGYRSFQCRKLILAAGTLGSARLVMASLPAVPLKLPILANLLSYVPLMQPGLVGSPQPTEAYYTQLNLMYDPGLGRDRVMGTFHSLTGILTSDVLCELPLPLGDAVAVAKYLLPAMILMQVWHPSPPSPGNYVALTNKGDLEIEYRDKLDGQVEKRLIATLRRSWFLTAFRFCRFPSAAYSLHYAGTLPMRNTPAHSGETFPDGRLGGSKRVYVADASTFGFLPAKNHSMTMMANAMRIADGIHSTLSAP